MACFPSFVRKLAMEGFLMMETKLTLMIVDSPVGYVWSVNRITPLKFSIIEVVYKAKLFMKKIYLFLIKDTTSLNFVFIDDSGKNPIPPLLRRKEKEQSAFQLLENK
ncbi:unnamed protein product [Rhizopus stolonifer]